MMACSTGAGVLIEGAANRSRRSAARTNLLEAQDLLSVGQCIFAAYWRPFYSSRWSSHRPSKLSDPKLSL